MLTVAYQNFDVSLQLGSILLLPPTRWFAYYGTFHPREVLVSLMVIARVASSAATHHPLALITVMGNAR